MKQQQREGIIYFKFKFMKQPSFGVLKIQKFISAQALALSCWFIYLFCSLPCFFFPILPVHSHTNVDQT